MTLTREQIARIAEEAERLKANEVLLLRHEQHVVVQFWRDRRLVETYLVYPDGRTLNASHR